MSAVPSPIVSVLMPCYNAVDTLPEALDSLQRQTLLNYEIIAVEDGSSDGSLEILRARARYDPRLKVISLAHGGVVAALQAGLAACYAPYVARMDSDDRSYPERLEHQVAFLEAHPQVGVVGCLVRGFPPGGVRRGFRIYIQWLNSLVTDADIRREIFVESPLAHPSVIFRKQAVLQAGGYQEHGWPEDYDLWLRLYLKGERFAKLPETLLDWREHPDRLTRTDGRYSVENFLRAKAQYIVEGPLADRGAVLIWGAGMIGRRLSKHLVRRGAPVQAFLDINPLKIGKTLRGLPILAVTDLPGWWQEQSIARNNPAILAAVSARGARQIIRQHLTDLGLVEGQEWWSVA